MQKSLKYFLLLAIVISMAGCSKTREDQVVPLKNVSWTPEIELLATWPKGPKEPRGKGAYLSLLDQTKPPLILSEINGDYLVVANRFAGGSEGLVTIIISATANQNLKIQPSIGNFWQLGRKITVKCPKKLITITPDGVNFRLDGDVYSIICISPLGVSRIVTTTDSLGPNFPTAISKETADYLLVQGIEVSTQ